jgi:hypothetical protein
MTAGAGAGGDDQRYEPADLHPAKSLVTHFMGCWVASRTVLDGCEEEKILCRHQNSNPEPSCP